MEEKPQGTWKDQLGDQYEVPPLCDVPDYIVADIKNLKATENTALRQIAQPIEFPIPYDDLREIAQMKWKFENDDEGFSISAPQLGFSKRVMCYFIPRKLVKIKAKHKFPVYTLYNPSFEPLDDEMILDYEKCRSVKDVCALVNRYENIHYKAYNFDGELIEDDASGALARWIQHEVDHMNGLLFTDQAAKIITIKEHRFRRSVGKIVWHMDV